MASENSKENTGSEDVEQKNSASDTNIVENGDAENQHSPQNEDLSEDALDKFQLKTSTDDEDEDDVPGDFFDDFLKEDFMAGLDIVDDDDWNDEKEKQMDKTSPKKKGRHLMPQQKEETRKTNRNDKYVNKNTSLQRDPMKTKRDIERDKERCEKKIITEKLQLVETGLIPPGMETEIDLDLLKKQKEEETKESSEKPLSKKNVSPKSSSTSSNKKIFPKKVSPKKMPWRNPRPKSRSPRRRSRSPRRRSRSPRRNSRSPRRRNLRLAPRSPNPKFRDPKGKDLRFRELPLRRRSLDHNPRRSIDRSPIRRRRSRSRSRSAKRRKAEKKSFLQEIAEKLNETRPIITYPTHLPPAVEQYHVPLLPQQIVPPVPVPAPVPAPPLSTQYPLQPQRYDRYDQSFFIGTPTPHPQVNTQLQLPNAMPAQPILPTAQVSHINSNFDQPQMQMNLAPQEPNEYKVQEDLNKLFHDKKISLTEFLAITAKPEVYSASPEHLKEKVKVIARCQEAIKYLGHGEKKFTGPLVIQNTPTFKAPHDKMKSPLLKASQMKFAFTEVSKKKDHEFEFSNYLNGLLEKIGLAEPEVIVIDDAETERPVETVPLHPPPAPQLSKPRTDTVRLPPRHGVNQLSKFVQTETFNCPNCERRNKITHHSVGVQIGTADPYKFSVSTQVREDDFYATLPKNKSLASLTPAQLLARSNASMGSSRSIDVEDFDILFPVQQKPMRQPIAFSGSRISPPSFPLSSSRGLNYESPLRTTRPDGSGRYNNYF